MSPWSISSCPRSPAPERLAQELGYSSYQQMIQFLNENIHFSQLGLEFDTRKWGFLYALLTAEPFDSISVGTLNLVTLTPYVEYSKNEVIWEKNCRLMIGTRTLSEYFDKVVLMPDIANSLIMQYWRNTSPSYYKLLQISGQVHSIVDGSDKSDIPDFHSIDLSLQGSRNFSAITDRFGNLYFSFGTDLGIGAGGLYSEGYVCDSTSCLDKDLNFILNRSYINEDYLTDTLPGISAGMTASFDLGVGAWVVITDRGVRNISTFSMGLAYGLSLSSVSYTINSGVKNPAFGWDWAITDRLNGIKFNDISKFEREK